MNLEICMKKDDLDQAIEWFRDEMRLKLNDKLSLASFKDKLK